MSQARADQRPHGHHGHGPAGSAPAALQRCPLGSVRAHHCRGLTDTGLVGLGEMGGGGESAELAFQGLRSYVLGHDPLELEALRWKIANPTASLYNNRLQLLAALEFACLEIAGQALGVSVSTLLGGRL